MKFLKRLVGWRKSLPGLSGRQIRVPESHSRRRLRRGMTMIELVGVIIIIVMLLGIAGLSVSRNVKRSNREAVVNELQVYSTSIADAYYDLGAPTFDPSASDDEAKFKRWLQSVEDGYLALSFDWNTLQATTNGYSIDSASPLDVFENPYHFWFITDESTMKFAMVASGGEDGLCNYSGYATGQYQDDIVLVVRPKT